MNLLFRRTNLYMELALEEAKESATRGSIPVGAVIVWENEIISRAGNEVLKNNDPTSHAEIVAIRAACRQLNSHFIPSCDIYVTLEPCAMCAEAISLARIRRLYFGAYDTKYGAVINGCRVLDSALHKPEIIGGIAEKKCAEIITDFFRKKRSSS